MKKRIVLCADDYGQAAEISEGIISLIKQGNLTATSCIVNTPAWLEHADWLKQTQIPYPVDVGLHLNLTEGTPLSAAFKAQYGLRFPSLSKLMQLALTRRLKYSAVKAELAAQLDRFEAGMGHRPDFIDGHHHIHQFPVIRKVLIQMVEERFVPPLPYIRSVNPTLRSGDFGAKLKKLAIFISGSRTFNQLLHLKDIPTNTSFSGMYDFKHAAAYRFLFPTFLREVKDGGLIMCHPGFALRGDKFSLARAFELSYLQSHDFNRDCEAAGIEWSRGARLSPSWPLPSI